MKYIVWFDQVVAVCLNNIWVFIYQQSFKRAMLINIFIIELTSVDQSVL